MDTLLGLRATLLQPLPRGLGAWLLLLTCAPALALARPEKAEPARVRAARKHKGDELREWFKAAKVAYPARAVLLRAFKREGLLELWAGDDARRPLSLVHTFAICATSGGPGPKRAQGDGQVPEGFYAITKLNPWSNFHLSLRVDYPNRADRRRSRAKALGTDIYIHGNCVTIGCLPLGDGPIEALYVAVLDAKAAGATVEAHLFPARMDHASLEPLARRDAELRGFWEELRAGYTAFEASRVLPRIDVDSEGKYVVTAR